MKWTNVGHEFDTVGENLQKIEKIYFYGIGGNLKEIWEIISEANSYFDNIDFAFIDRNERVRNKGYAGNKIMSPDEFYNIVKEETKTYIVISCPIGNVGEEIQELMVSNGISKEKIISGFDFMFSYIPIYFMYKHNLLFFTSQNIVPSSACNLNCRDCLNFNPYIKKPVIHSIEEEKRDVDLFFNAVDLIWRFQVTGGEPFLYPHFKDFLEYIHNNYKDKILRLETVTNGTIVPSDELCNFLAEKKIFVFLDDYSMALDDKHKAIREDIEEKFKKYGVKYNNNYVDKWFKIYPRKDEFEGNLENFFSACDNPWSTVEGGKITACNYSLYAHKAGLVNDCDTDYYNLVDFDEAKKKELLEFRLRYNKRGYTSFCEKCAGFSVINKNYYYPAIQSLERGYVNEVDK